MSDWELFFLLIPIELANTIYMVFFSTLFSVVLGLPLGIKLYLSDNQGLNKNRWVYQTLGFFINIGRSIPFAILMIAIIPFTRMIVGTSIGTTASIVPLTLAGIPFMARLVEMGLKKIDRELIEASLVMGSTTKQIIMKVMLPEMLPSLTQGITLTAVNLIGYSAMAGLVGGGGLGKVAIQYGYQRFNGFLMLTTLIVLLILVAITQGIGNFLTKKIMKKRGIT